MGAGKTHIANLLCGTRMEISDSWQSCTNTSTTCNTALHDKHGAYISILDTVGFSDNSAEGGHARSLINTLDAMNGKVVCQIAYVHGCHSRLEVAAVRSLRSIEELTGIDPVLLLNDRGLSDCYKLPKPSEQNSAEVAYLAKKSFATLSKLAGNISHLPGVSQCREIKLPDGWEDLILGQDYDHIKQSLGEYAKHQCDAILHQYQAAVADVREAKSLLRIDERDLEDKRVEGPAAVEMSCPEICLRRTEQDPLYLIFKTVWETIFELGTKVQIKLDDFGLPPGNQEIECLARGPDPTCVAEVGRLKGENKEKFNAQILQMEARIFSTESKLQNALEHLKSLSVDQSRCSNMVIAASK